MVINNMQDAYTYEQRLTEIFKLLKPPQQDYATLADQALKILDELYKKPDVPFEVRALAQYFQLFAAGYAHWQQSYDYPRIREYFYGAYLQTREIASGQSPILIEMSEMITKAMIAYIDCENALISNSSQGLLQSSKRAIDYGKKAQACLNAQKMPESIKESIKSYLEMNLHLWQGLEICAQGYLDAEDGRALSSAKKTDMEGILQALEEESSELFSELNAHYSFVQQHCQLRAHKKSALRVENGTIFLRAIGYVGEKLVSAFFNDFNKEEKEAKGALQDEMAKRTGLPIKTMGASELMDIFETVLGKKYLDQITIDFSPIDPVLTFKIYKEKEEKEIDYEPDVFRVSIARYGVISAEIGVSLKKASVSHVRALESLIGPHAGRYSFTWKGQFGDPAQILETAHSINALETSNRINSVEYFLRCRDILKSLPPDELTDIRDILVKWERTLCDLAIQLPQRSVSSASGTEVTEADKKLEKVYQDLQKCFDNVSEIVHNYPLLSSELQEPALGRLNTAKEELKKIFIEGRNFGHLMNLAEFAIKGIQKFLTEKYGLQAHSSGKKKATQRTGLLQTKSQDLPASQDLAPIEDIRYLPAFDASMGWQSIISCSQIVVVNANGRKVEPLLGTSDQDVLQHPEFKGFAVQPREARAGIDDWIFVEPPHINNLATIRSHEKDILYVGTNKVFLWFPDDPEFLVNQYIETARIIADIRVIVLTFNNSAKNQMERMEEFFEWIEEVDRSSSSAEMTKKDHTKNLGQRILGRIQRLDQRSGHAKKLSPKEIQHELLQLRSGIEIFYIHAEKILDLLRACTVSKYQDHGELLKKMLRESKADDSQLSLERNVQNLGRFHSYISGLLEQRIEQRNRANQNLIAWYVFILTVLSAVSALPALYTFLRELFGTMNGILLESIVGIIVFVIVGCVLIGLIVWRRSNKA